MISSPVETYPTFRNGKIAVLLPTKGAVPAIEQPNVDQLATKVKSLVDDPHAADSSSLTWERSDSQAIEWQQAAFDWCQQQKSLNRTRLIWVGMGGSILGPRAITSGVATWRNPMGTIEWLDHLDRQSIEKIISAFPLEQTAFAVVSKSGSTTETNHIVKLLNTIVESEGLSLADRCAIVTNPNSQLDDPSLGTVLYFGHNTGGRFSTLSSVGALAIGWQFGHSVWETMRHAAAKYTDQLCSDLEHDPAFVQAWHEYSLPDNNLIQATITYDCGLEAMLALEQQLVMESLGKDNTDNQPAVLTGVGSAAQHSIFQWLHQSSYVPTVAFWLTTRGTFSTDKLQRDLAYSQIEGLGGGEYNVGSNHFAGDRSVSVVVAPDLSPEVIGQWVAMIEWKTILRGWLMGLNPFDQPGVELGKELARQSASGSGDRYEKLQSLKQTIEHLF